MEDRAVREKTEAEVFAELCALPEQFDFGVERRIVSYKVDDNGNATPDPPSWYVSLSIGEDGAMFSARRETLAQAWADVRGQIAAFTEVL